MEKGFRQVNISEKEVSYRYAEAEGEIILKKETIRRIKQGGVEKGDPLSLATISSILAAKNTQNIVLLSHNIRIEGIEPVVEVKEDRIKVRVGVHAREKTGVEMEALTAVCAALLNIWDSVKKYEKDEKGQYPSTVISSIRVRRKIKDGSH